MIKKWVLKAIVQKTISYLPLSNKINYIFQKHVTKGVYLSDEYFYDRLGHAKAHLAAYKAYSHRSTPASCLELGTGWYPVVPIGFYLVGVETIYSADISFLTSKERIATTIKKYTEARERGVLADYLADIDEARFAVLQDLLQQMDTLTLEEVLSKLRLKYLIEDARSLSLPDNSIDLVNSNNTFEHIYPAILSPILKDFKRVVSKDHGVMSHFIDMSDHFAHFDKSITMYNFLQFSDSAWKWIDNSIQPMSRLRIDDYKAMYGALAIPITEESHRDGNIEEVKNMQVAAKFAAKPAAIVAISHCHFVSDMKA